MYVKIIENYRDSKMNLELVPKNVILEVTKERANELIKAGVAEEYIFSIPKIETTVDMKPVEIVVNTKKSEIKKNK